MTNTPFHRALHCVLLALFWAGLARAQTPTLPDSFAAAAVTTNRAFNLANSLFSMTAEPEEPGHAGQPALRSRWVRFRPSYDGYFGLTFPQHTGLRLAFYTGDTLSQLQPVASRVLLVTDTSFGIPVSSNVVYSLAIDTTAGGVNAFNLTAQLATTYLSGVAAGQAFLAPAAVAGVIRRFSLIVAGKQVDVRTNEPWVIPFTNLIGGTVSAAADVLLAGSVQPVRTPPLQVNFLPPNDNFAQAAEIASDLGSAQISGNALFATVETNEPALVPTNVVHRTIWWRWSPGFPAFTRVNWSSRVAVFRGSALANLEALAGSSATGLGFEPVVGETYWFRADVTGNVLGSGNVGFDLNRTVLSLVPLTPLTVIPTPEGPKVFGRANTPLRFAAQNVSPVETVSELRLVRMDDGTVIGTAAGSPGEFAYLPSEAQTLSVRIEGVNQSGQLRFSEPLALVVAPANDDFADARIVESGFVGEQELAGHLSLGGMEPGEPRPPTAPATHSVWYRWTAPWDGTARLDLPEQPSGVWATAYTGDSLVSLKSMATGSNREGTPGLHLAFEAEAGVTYALQFVGDTPTEPVRFTFFPIRWQIPDDVISQGDTASLLAVVSDPARTPVRIAFRRGETELGAVTAAPFRFDWIPESSGPLSLTVVADFGAGPIILATKTLMVTPANDRFARATPLGTTASGQPEGRGTTAHATQEAGEVSSFGDQDGTVWFDWTAPATEVLWLRQIRGVNRVRLDVFVGEGLATLGLRASYGDIRAPTAFSTVAGTRYRFAVSEAGPAAGGEFAFVLGVRPANDNFAAAKELIPPPDGVVTLDSANTLATLEPEELAHPAFSAFGPNGTLWWKWTATEISEVMFQLQESDCNTVAGVFTGDSLADLVPVVPVAPAKVGGAGYSGWITFRARPGKTYYFAAGGYETLEGPALGRMKGWFRAEPMPNLVNDFFADRLPLSGTNLVLQVNPTGAGLEPGEISGQFGVHYSLWYAYRAPVDGALRLTLRTSNPFATPYPKAVAYRGTTLEMLVPVDASGDIYLGAGEELQIAVSGPNTGFEMQLEFHVPNPPSSNDAFADRIPITTPDYETTGSLRQATVEPNEPVVQPVTSGSLWWSITPPSSGVLELEAAGDNFGAYPQLFSGAQLDSLTGPLGYANDGRVGWRLQAGLPYALKLGASYGVPGDFSLRTRFFLTATNDAFAHRIRIASADFQLRTWLYDATAEPGERLPAALARQTLWWSWAAPADGRLEVLDWDATLQPLAVYTGPAVDQLQRVASRPFHLGGITGGVHPVVAGTVYHLQVAAKTNEIVPIDLRFRFRPFGPAATDNFSDARVLEGVEAGSVESLVGATREPGEPKHRGSATGASVWWRWTAPNRGQVEIKSHSGTVGDAMFAVYQGSSVDALRLIRQGTAPFQFFTEAGQTYQIAAEVPEGRGGDVGLFVGVVRTSGPPVPVPGNVVKNPSFEELDNGVPSLHWEFPTGLIGVVGGPAADGANYVVLQRNTVRQEVPTESGHNYRLRFAWTGYDEDGAARFMVRINGQEVGRVQFQADYTRRYWHWQDYDFVATSPTTLVELENDGARVGFDAVSVVWLNRPPAIVIQPQGLSVFAGNPVVFTAGAEGSEPLQFQWWLGSSPLPGATNRLLELAAATPADAGPYRVVVTNPWGRASSVQAALVVESAASPQIVVQPAGEKVVAGQYVALSVVAVGTPPLRYQWFRNGLEIASATNRELVFKQVGPGDFADYHVVVRNAGESVTSLPAAISPASNPPLGGTLVQFHAWEPDPESGVDTTVFDVDGVTRLRGDRFVAQLYAGPTLDGLRPVGEPQPFLTGFYEGYWQPVVVTLPNVPPRTRFVAQVRAWERAFGAGYEEARALGGRFGRSLPLTLDGADPKFEGAVRLIALPNFKLAAGLPDFTVGRIEAGLSPDGGQLVFRLTGARGFRYLLERRQDGTDWKPVQVFEDFPGEANFAAPISDGTTVLYRARILD